MKITTIHDLRAGELFMSAVAAPLERLADVPTWAKVVAPLFAFAQYATHDAFGGALSLLFGAGVVDYIAGVKAARYVGAYNPNRAYAGAMSKITGVLLLFLVRWMEYYVSTQGLINTRGAAATAIAVSLIAVDLQSIAHHRESFGAQPIPVLSSALAWLQRVASGRIPASGDKA